MSQHLVYDKIPMHGCFLLCFQYQYTVDSNDFDVTSFQTNSIKLDSNVLNILGGKTYTVTVKGQYYFQIIHRLTQILMNILM